jgi:hypothetical protein
MFAGRDDSDIYHLAARDQKRTLCGLQVLNVKSGSGRAQWLQLMHSKPSGRTLCKHCERLSDLESKKEK